MPHHPGADASFLERAQHRLLAVALDIRRGEPLQLDVVLGGAYGLGRVDHDVAVLAGPGRVEDARAEAVGGT